MKISWKNIQLIWRREIRDQLRDRRTLFMVAVLPLLLYPALGIGMAEMTLMFREQARTVVVLGSENIPEPTLIDGSHFASQWFAAGEDPKKLVVVSDAVKKQPGDDSGEIRPATESNTNVETSKADTNAERELSESQQRQLDLAREIVARLKQQSSTKEDNPANDDKSEQPNAPESDESKKQQDELSQLLTDEIQVLVVFPDGFKNNIEQLKTGDYPRPQIIHNQASEKSVIAYRRVAEVLRSWERSLLERRLEAANLPPKWTQPVAAESVDVSVKSQIAANVWSKIFPGLLILMAVTGAFYPAVDVAAGEKERGTMETLLICPARRSEIVLGKFLTVLLFSISTALLNLASMGFTGKYMFGMGAGGAIQKMGSLDFPSWGALVWVVVLLIPIAMLFSALSLALATFARSSKEGQYYLTPLLTVTMGLTMFCLSPAVELTPFFSVLPVIGPTLLLKALLSAPGATEPLTYAAPVLATSFAYSLIALWWAIDQFAREDILFREAERFELGLWFRHLLRDKEDFPTFSEAIACFTLIMFLQFGAMSFLGRALNSATPGNEGAQMMKILMVQQIALIASPALFMGVMLTKSVVKTFRLRLPNWKILLAAGVLPIILHPVVLEMMTYLSTHFFPALDENLAEKLKVMDDASQPVWLIITAFALAPAICEEVAFRGFILSGFAHTGRFGIAIALSAFTFGIMHMIPQQVFNATLFGLLLGLIAIRSRSLIPGILFHFINNALGVLHGRNGTDVIAWVEQQGLTTFASSIDGHLRYHWPTLILCSTLALVIITWIYRIELRPVTTEERQPSAETAS